METNPKLTQATLRGAIARLVAAMMAADRRLTTDEIDEAARLDRIGLGPPSLVVQEELQRATRMPIDVDGACTALCGNGPALIGTVLSMLADVAMSDGAIDQREAQLFSGIASRLGTTVRDIHAYARSDEPTEHVESTVSRTSPTPSVPAGDDGAKALQALGLGTPASRADIDAAYLGLVGRYDPAKVAPLGAELVVLAVRKLAALSDLYEVARDTATS